jgi:peptidoglycan/xylan/chitin deacetylase (PgdA/CDA1 family)
MRRTFALLALVGALVMAACAPAAVVGRGPTGRRDVTLTFDVAYDARYTASFLDVLRRYGVKATMFVTGEWADANPALVRRMANEGHLVGNHSYSHPEFTKISDREIARQLARTDAAISARTNRSTKPYFRPPYGAQDARVNRGLGDEGYRYDVLWTVDSLGWKGLTAPEVVRRCIERAAPGAILMFHLSAKPDLDALPWVIQWLRNNNYRLVRLDAWWS